GQFQQLAGHYFLTTVNLGDAVAGLYHRADLGHGHAAREVLNLLADDVANLVGFDRFHNFETMNDERETLNCLYSSFSVPRSSFYPPAICCLICCKRVRTEPS